MCRRTAWAAHRGTQSRILFIYGNEQFMPCPSASISHTNTHTLTNWNETSSEAAKKNSSQIQKLNYVPHLRFYGWHHVAFNVDTLTHTRGRAGMCQLTPVRSDVIRTVPWVALLLHGFGCKQHAYTRDTTHKQPAYRPIRSFVINVAKDFAAFGRPSHFNVRRFDEYIRATSCCYTYFVPEHFSLRLRLLPFFLFLFLNKCQTQPSAQVFAKNSIHTNLLLNVKSCWAPSYTQCEGAIVSLCSIVIVAIFSIVSIVIVVIVFVIVVVMRMSYMCLASTWNECGACYLMCRYMCALYSRANRESRECTA